VIESPSGRLPAKVPRWDLEETETCGGRKSVSGGSLLVCEYFRIYRLGIRSRGGTRGPQACQAHPTPQGAPGELVAPSCNFRSSLEASWVSSGPRKTNPKFFLRLDFVWYCFPKKPKTCRKQKLALGTKLIG
jgi:hypothetical protein